MDRRMQQNKENIKYHVTCKANGNSYIDGTKVDGMIKVNEREFKFRNAHCFKITVSQIWSAQAIHYGTAALNSCCTHIRKTIFLIQLFILWPVVLGRLLVIITKKYIGGGVFI